MAVNKKIKIFDANILKQYIEKKNIDGTSKPGFDEQQVTCCTACIVAVGVEEKHGYIDDELRKVIVD